MYHDLYNQKTKQIDSMISTLKEMMLSLNESDNDDDDDDDEDIDDYNDAFIESKMNLNEYELTDEEKLKSDRFPAKHKNDPDHKDLLKIIKDKGIQYCIGEKTSHLDKFINIMINDAKTINLKINRIE